MSKAQIVKGSVVEEIKDMPVPEKPDDLLVSILRTKRAHLSQGDTNFRLWLHSHFKKLGVQFEILAEGCILVRTDVKSDTLFSCHIDTCHNHAESNGTFQDLAYDPTFGDILLGQGSTSACLGADDGAGIYIMLKMIEAKVPGSYLFHTGEERGGIGAYAVLAKHKTLLEDFSRAIAFDRAVQRDGEPEVIITQGGTPCASVEAGKALCDALNKSGAVFQKPYVVSYKGSFTDTKVYKSIIAECINVGVWYAAQHTPKEWLSVAGLEQLLKACLTIQWDELPVKRIPVADTPAYKGGYGGYKGSLFDDDNWDAPKQKPKAMPKKPTLPSTIGLSLLEEVETYKLDDMIALCEESPTEAASLMLVLKAKLDGAKAELEATYTMLGVS